MAKLPERSDSETVRRIYALHESRDNEPARPYLGASAIGNPCERALWYGFRWATCRQFDGRMLRLFDGRMLRLFETGHREEARMLAELRAIGIDVHERGQDGQQFGFSAPETGHHLRGHLDGLAVGVPEAPKAPHVIECKTHSAKSFADLTSKGVREAKPQHYAQMMLYMHWTVQAWGNAGCKRALYIAQNKDTDHLYTERIRYDADEAEAIVARAQRIIRSSTPPDRLSDDPAYYVCKWCDYHQVCHGGSMPDVTCRTCAHATPESDGDARWTCAINGNNDIPLDWQRGQHDCHRYIPPLIEQHFTLHDYRDGNEATWINVATGAHVCQPGYTSAEMQAAQDKRAIGHPAFDAIRAAFDGRIVD